MTEINVEQGKAKSGQEVEEASEPAATEGAEEGNDLATTGEVDETEVDEANELAATASSASQDDVLVDIITPDLVQEQLTSLRLANEQHRSDNKARTQMMVWAEVVVAVVLFLSAIGIGVYLWASFWVRQEMPDSSVLITWLSSTVVEVIGIMYVIARYLFPQSGTGEDTKKASSVKKDS